MNILSYIIALLLLFGCIISLSAAAVPNVRSVVRQDGAVVESNEYYPYGGLNMLHIKTEIVYKY